MLSAAHGQDREDGTFLVTTTIGGYYGGELEGREIGRCRGGRSGNKDATFGAPGIATRNKGLTTSNKKLVYRNKNK